LFFVAAGIRGAAVGDFAVAGTPASPVARVARLLAMSASALVLLVGGAIYALLKTQEEGVNHDLTVATSIAAYVLAAVAVLVADATSSSSPGEASR
jgi:cytochrome bd-type quinol oxidase subunit 2